MSAASTSEDDLPVAATDEVDLPPEVLAAAGLQKRKRLGWIVVIAIALGIPILALTVTYFLLDWSGDRLAEEAIANARAAGDPVTVEEMEAYYGTSPEIEEATAHWLRAGEIISDPAFGTWTKGVPIVGAGPSRDIVDAENVQTVSAFLDRCRIAIDEVHAARDAGGVARFPVDFREGAALLLPHVQNQRTLMNVLRVDLEAHVYAGDDEAVVADLLSMLAVCDSLSNEPILISQLVRIACLKVTTDALEQALPRVDLKDDQLARLQEAFATQQFRDAMRRWARGEQFFLIHVVQSDLPAGDPLLERTRWLPARGDDLAKGMELWRPVIDASGEGMREGIDAAEAMSEEVDALTTSPVDQFRYATTALLLPAVQAASKALLQAEAEARVAQTALACERFRLRNDRYPKSLDELVPEHLSSVLTNRSGRCRCVTFRASRRR